VAEESLLRGSLFRAIQSRASTGLAIAVTSVAFGVLHAPVYGWAVVPLDIAVGVWLGALRAVSGTVAAPAVAHAVADLAGWWLR
jgi:membrane protease YdiL (CAAX protease family)